MEKCSICGEKAKHKIAYAEAKGVPYSEAFACDKHLGILAVKSDRLILMPVIEKEVRP